VQQLLSVKIPAASFVGLAASSIQYISTFGTPITSQAGPSTNIGILTAASSSEAPPQVFDFSRFPTVKIFIAINSMVTVTGLALQIHETWPATTRFSPWFGGGNLGDIALVDSFPVTPPTTLSWGITQFTGAIVPAGNRVTTYRGGFVALAFTATAFPATSGGDTFIDVWGCADAVARSTG